MKVFAITDTHGDTSWINDRPLDDVDVIVHAGDVSDWGRMDLPPVPFQSWPRLFIIGNHDTADISRQMCDTGWTNIDWRSALIDEVAFLGVPFHHLSQVEISLPVDNIKTRVIVSHEPPRIPPYDEFGSAATACLVKGWHPDLVIFGHIHETFGRSVTTDGLTMVNPGDRGMVIEI